MIWCASPVCLLGQLGSVSGSKHLSQHCELPVGRRGDGQVRELLRESSFAFAWVYKGRTQNSHLNGRAKENYL